VASGTPDPNPTNNSDSVSTTVVAAADLWVDKSGPAEVGAGQNVTYTITLTNKGPDTAHNVKLTSELPAALTFVSCDAGEGVECAGEGNNRAVTFPSLQSGGSVTVTVVATVNEDLAEGTVVNHEVRVESPTPDAQRNDNHATVASTVYH
jgi:uncharacterized repeat protein (TIGR01451 family)